MQDAILFALKRAHLLEQSILVSLTEAMHVLESEIESVKLISTLGTDLGDTKALNMMEKKLKRLKGLHLENLRVSWNVDEKVINAK